MANDVILSIKALSKYFGGLAAIKSIDIDVTRGNIVSIIGPNGSGKTTFFNLISGLYTPTDGEILFKDRNSNLINIVGKKPFEITLSGIARTFQNLRLFSNMSVIENVMVGMHGCTKKGAFSAIFRSASFKEEEKRIYEESEKLLSFFGNELFNLRFQSAKYLSYANQRRLEILRAIATNPKILLLDEPAAGMNPTEKNELMKDIRRLCENGYTIILIEHDMILVRHISDYVIAFDHGEKIAEGSFEEVRSTPQVITAYLGKGAIS